MIFSSFLSGSFSIKKRKIPHSKSNMKNIWWTFVQRSNHTIRFSPFLGGKTLNCMGTETAANCSKRQENAKPTIHRNAKNGSTTPITTKPCPISSKNWERSRQSTNSNSKKVLFLDFAVLFSELKSFFAGCWRFCRTFLFKFVQIQPKILFLSLFSHGEVLQDFSVRSFCHLFPLLFGQFENTKMNANYEREVRKIWMEECRTFHRRIPKIESKGMTVFKQLRSYFSFTIELKITTDKLYK